MAEELFLIRENAELGRFGVASKDLKAGDVVFKEFPFAVGPKTDTTTACLTCNVSIDWPEGNSKCTLCGWPLCKDCNGKVTGLHADNECKVFQENKVKFQGVAGPEEICHQLDCITPLR